jgi:hypothetical protein
MYYKLICILYALLCGQNFILVKSGVTNLELLSVHIMFPKESLSYKRRSFNILNRGPCL